jgi:hypothetical protein
MEELKSNIINGVHCDSNGSSNANSYESKNNMRKVRSKSVTFLDDEDDEEGCIQQEQYQAHQAIGDSSSQITNNDKPFLPNIELKQREHVFDEYPTNDEEINFCNGGAPVRSIMKKSLTEMFSESPVSSPKLHKNFMKYEQHQQTVAAMPKSQTTPNLNAKRREQHRVVQSDL